MGPGAGRAVGARDRAGRWAGLALMLGALGLTGCARGIHMDGPPASVPESAAGCAPAAAAERERAAERFRSGAYGEVEAYAASVVARCPSDLEAWELLASTRFLAGDREGALRAWNRLGRPVIDRIEWQDLGGNAPEGARSRAIPTALVPGSMLTPERLVAVERRVGSAPAVHEVRASYRPIEGGRAVVSVRVAERRFARPGWLDLAVVAARTAASRTLRLEIPPPGVPGELWTLSERRRGSWRSGEVRLEGATGRSPGAWHVGLTRDGGRFGGRGVLPRRERGAFLSVGVTHWAWTSTRIELEGGVGRWRIEHADGAGTGRMSDPVGRLGVSVLLHPLSGRFREGALALSLRRWSRAAPGGGFWTGRVEARGGAPEGPLGLDWRARTGFAAASSGAPRGLWPRVGATPPADIPLRAHSPFTGEAPSTIRAVPRSIHGGAEVVRWLARAGPLRAGLAGFLDVAALADETSGASWTGALDAGGGLRIDLGARGELRIDLARDLRTGGTLGSIDWGLPGDARH